MTRFAALLMFLVATSVGATDVRPNIVIILADDLGWSDLGCYGNRYNESPNLDRLASQGIRFTQFYAGPVCSPTRANMQSGQDQARFGITQHIPGHRRPFAKLIDPVVTSQLPLEVETFAESLSAVGYRTGYFGKWHLGGADFGPQQQGWQTALQWTGHEVPSNLTDGSPAPRTAEFLTDQAIEFIGANRDRPFLLQVSHFAVHIPLNVTARHLAQFRAKQPVAGYPSRPEYAALVYELDEGVGRLVDAIDRFGLGERTLVLFLSDNGGLEHEQSGTMVTSNAPLRNEKGTLYEGGIRVPAIARWSSVVPPGKVCDQTLTTIDIHATVRDIAAVRWDNQKQPNDGQSFAEVLKAPGKPRAPRTLFWHLPHYHHSTPSGAIRIGGWKLIEFFEDGSTELYRLSDDLSEQDNLAQQHPAIVADMQQQLARWRDRVSARMPTPNPDYDPAKANQLAVPKSPK